MKRKDYEISSGNVFADLKLEESEELFARAQLMHRLALLIKASGKTQKEVAEKLGISQPKVSMILSEKFNEFSSEKLMHYLSLMGCYVEINIRNPIRKNIFLRQGYIAVCP